MRKWQAINTDRIPPTIQAFKCGPLRALVSKDNGRWHISVSRHDRYPTWDEIKAARYDLLPNDIYMAQILPPKEKFINVHPNCFHLWEVPHSPEYD